MDLQTLNVVILFICMIMAGSMFSLHHAIPREACLRDWGWAGLLHIVPTLAGLAMLAGHGLPWALVALSNLAYVGGNTMILVGVRRFLGLDTRFGVVLGLLVLVYAANWLPVLRASFPVRLAFLYVVLALVNLCGLQALLANLTRGMRGALWTMAATQGLFVLQAAVRIPILLFADLQDMAPASSTLLRSSGCLATLLYLLLTNMACALVVARRQELGLSEAALRDTLTGLHNRRSLAQQADRRFARSTRSGSGFGIVTIDIDHFKRINDAHGHAVGDAAIRHLAALSEQALRPQDVLARLGGEEFCAVIDCESDDALLQVAERWRAAVEAAPLALNGEHVVALTVSVGYSLRGEADRCWDDVLRRADAALYAAKNDGRNRVGRPVYQAPDVARLMPGLA